MSEIIKLTDVDIDGNGTNIETLIQVDGTPLTNGVINRVKEVIANFKKENDEDFDTDGCLNAASKQLETEGYKVKYLVPHIEIDF